MREKRTPPAAKKSSQLDADAAGDRGPCNDWSFDALVHDDLVRLVMASDHVSETELEALREVRPLIDDPGE